MYVPQANPNTCACTLYSHPAKNVLSVRHKICYTIVNNLESQGRVTCVQH